MVTTLQRLASRLAKFRLLHDQSLLPLVSPDKVGLTSTKINELPEMGRVRYRIVIYSSPRIKTSEYGGYV